MNIPAPQPPKMMSLMTELCDLMRKVLGKETETDIDARIAEMMVDFNEIKGRMERYTKAMEALIPATQAMKSMSEMQHEIKCQLAEQGEHIRWLRHQLSQPVFRE